mmetsp:Transcript_30675/g.93888  ORF Transcript_30675/g.93888 Transcript_30675/m.93888 type:complete len:303 (-) Transcript_30675:24-932(-)
MLARDLAESCLSGLLGCRVDANFLTELGGHPRARDTVADLKETGRIDAQECVEGLRVVLIERDELACVLREEAKIEMVDRQPIKVEDVGDLHETVQLFGAAVALHHVVLEHGHDAAEVLLRRKLPHQRRRVEPIMHKDGDRTSVMSVAVGNEAGKVGGDDADGRVQIEETRALEHLGTNLFSSSAQPPLRRLSEPLCRLLLVSGSGKDKAEQKGLYVLVRLAADAHVYLSQPADGVGVLMEKLRERGGGSEIDLVGPGPGRGGAAAEEEEGEEGKDDQRGDRHQVHLHPLRRHGLRGERGGR